MMVKYQHYIKEVVIYYVVCVFTTDFCVICCIYHKVTNTRLKGNSNQVDVLNLIVLPIRYTTSADSIFKLTNKNYISNIIYRQH